MTDVPNDPHGLIVCAFSDSLAVYRRDHPDVIHRYGGAGEFQLVLPFMVSGRNSDVAVTLRWEHWIVDPELRRVTVLVRDGDAWIERVAEGEKATAESVVLPGLAVRLEELWAVSEG